MEGHVLSKLQMKEQHAVFIDAKQIEAHNAWESDTFLVYSF